MKDTITLEDSRESFSKIQTCDEMITIKTHRPTSLWRRMLCTLFGWRDHKWQSTHIKACHGGPHYTIGIMVCERCGARQEVTSGPGGEKRHPIH